MVNQQVFFGHDDHQWSHLCDAGTWFHREAIVTPIWADGHRHIAVNTDDSGAVRELQLPGSMETLFPTETVESAKLSTVAQMDKESTGRQNATNSQV